MHFMLDFETLGNGKNACVIQIGACQFDRDTGEILDKFSLNIDAESAIQSGAEMDASTVLWWLQQSKEAITAVTRDPLTHIFQGFSELNEFLSRAETVWSHATFDFVILTETLKRLNLKPKFHYKVARDIRTLVDLSGINSKALPREGTHHNALDDCIYQVKYCVQAMNKLRSSGVT